MANRPVPRQPLARLPWIGGRRPEWHQRNRVTGSIAAADVSRRHLDCGKNGPPDVGGYTLSANRARNEIISILENGGRRKPNVYLKI